MLGKITDSIKKIKFAGKKGEMVDYKGLPPINSKVPKNYLSRKTIFENKKTMFENKKTMFTNYNMAKSISNSDLSKKESPHRAVTNKSPIRS
jgi:hypothetical protein